MTTSKRKQEDPSWIERQSHGRQRTDEVDDTLVEQQGMAWVDEESIERLLNESEVKGLQAREHWAKRRCGNGDLEHCVEARLDRRFGERRSWLHVAIRRRGAPAVGASAEAARVEG